MPSKLLIFLIGFSITSCLYAESPIEDHSSSKAYTAGSLVLVGLDSYIAIKDVPAGNTPSSSSEYWTNLSVAASTLSVPLETVPTLSTETILGSLPGSAPSDGNTSSGTIQIFSLSTRAGLFGSDMSASLNLGGSSNEAKKVMFRVKGPSMNFNGAKLANPWIDVYSRAATEGAPWSSEFESRTFGDHASSTTYADRHTGNNVEPLVVTSVTPSVFSCIVGSEDGGTGNAIVEIYSLDDDDTSSYFYSLSTRGYVSDSDMAGSMRLVGTGKKKIMFRVKGPSMNFSGTKLADPNLDIWSKKADGSWVQVVQSSTFGASYGFQSSDYTVLNASDYSNRHTGNNLEPMVVLELEEGTYSCLIGSDNGGEGNAILEIYSID